MRVYSGIAYFPRLFWSLFYFRYKKGAEDEIGLDLVEPFRLNSRWGRSWYIDPPVRPALINLQRDCSIR
jgi:hypothetical protein